MWRDPFAPRWFLQLWEEGLYPPTDPGLAADQLIGHTALIRRDGSPPTQGVVQRFFTAGGRIQVLTERGLELVGGPGESQVRFVDVPQHWQQRPMREHRERPAKQKRPHDASGTPLSRLEREQQRRAEWPETDWDRLCDKLGLNPWRNPPPPISGDAVWVTDGLRLGMVRRVEEAAVVVSWWDAASSPIAIDAIALVHITGAKQKIP